MKFSGSGIFKHIYEDPNRITKFEERVVITKASSETEAERQILADFKEYAQDGIVFVGEFTIAEIIESETVTEVSSTMRIYHGSDEEYLSLYWYDLQPESCDEKGWKHAWYNQGSGKSACYNCQEIRNKK
ncbi:hypothetical protein [Glaciecola sp. MF2-115]|uniref:hypothetical protein n=1 Tax=Glaciecola sp. MF2-115 TaxID=3384827 RepID=UPI00399F29B9